MFAKPLYTCPCAFRECGKNFIGNAECGCGGHSGTRSRVYALTPTSDGGEAGYRKSDDAVFRSIKLSSTTSPYSGMRVEDSDYKKTKAMTTKGKKARQELNMTVEIKKVIIKSKFTNIQVWISQ